MIMHGWKRSACLLLLVLPMTSAFLAPSSDIHASPNPWKKQAFCPESGNRVPGITPGTGNSQIGSSTSLAMMSTLSKAVVVGLRAGAPAAVEVSDIVTSAYEWCINLGNPSALVAGAVIATIYETMNSGDLDISKVDRPIVRFGKRLTRVLLLSAFAFEVISIFTTTVMGTMLLSETLDKMDTRFEITTDTTPLQFLQENFEFEYLTSRITFLQGLLNWLAAIALGHFVPQKDQNRDARNMNKFIGGALMTSIVVMLSFYNRHISFYKNYGHMIVRFLHCTIERFIFLPMRPLSVVYIPAAIGTLYYGFKAFFDAGQEEESNEA